MKPLFTSWWRKQRANISLHGGGGGVAHDTSLPIVVRACCYITLYVNFVIQRDDKCLHYYKMPNYSIPGARESYRPTFYYDLSTVNLRLAEVACLLSHSNLKRVNAWVLRGWCWLLFTKSKLSWYAVTLDPRDESFVASIVVRVGELPFRIVSFLAVNFEASSNHPIKLTEQWGNWQQVAWWQMGGERGYRRGYGEKDAQQRDIISMITLMPLRSDAWRGRERGGVERLCPSTSPYLCHHHAQETSQVTRHVYFACGVPP